MRRRHIFLTVCIASMIFITIMMRYSTFVSLEIHQSLSSRNNSDARVILASNHVNKSNSSQNSKEKQVLQTPEWRSIYESNIDLEKGRAAQTFCNIPRYTSTIFTTDASSDMSDWTFNKKKKCPKEDFGNFSIPRIQIFFNCSENYTTVSSSPTNRTDDIFQVPFGSKCLADVIDNCCNTEKLPVPNVVHYVWCKRQMLGFFQFLSFISVLRFIKPCMILFHGDALPYGSYWDFFVSVYPNIIHVKRSCPPAGNGHRLGFFEHGSDVMRLETLMFYGGIYLDWDEIMLRSVEKLRKFNYTQGFEESYFLGPQFVMAEKNATFLQHWYRGYLEDYRRASWNYNALELPVKLVKKFPQLIHVEGYNFTRPSWRFRNLIYSHNYDWATNYAMHLFLRHYKKLTDVNIIRSLNTTIGAISRHVIFGNKELCK